MNILHIISSANPESGGPIEAVLQMNYALQSKGHYAEVISLDQPHENFLDRMPFEVHALGPTSLGSYRYSQKLITWIRAHMKRFDVALVHGLWQFTGLGTWIALRDTNFPYLVYPHGMLDPWFKSTYPLKHLKKMVYWPLAEYLVLSNAESVLFTSESERQLSRQSFWPHRWRETVVGLGTRIPDGDPHAQRVMFLEAFPCLRSKRFLLFLGRIHPKKGCDLLIQAFSTVCKQDEEIHLVMAGPDQVRWRSDLEQDVKQLDLTERVIFTGMLGGDVKWGALRCAEAFVLPSHQENFGIAVVEALACETPVLLTHKVNIWQEIVNANAGLAADDSLAGVKYLLEQWLSFSDKERKLMKIKTHLCFLNHFEINASTDRLLEHLSKVISK